VVGILPFDVTKFHPPGLPPLPWISNFLETNVRTYLRAPDGSIGVWFFSLDTDQLFGVAGARLAFHLPYMCFCHAVVANRLGNLLSSHPHMAG